DIHAARGSTLLCWHSVELGRRRPSGIGSSYGRSRDRTPAPPRNWPAPEGPEDVLPATSISNPDVDEVDEERPGHIGRGCQARGAEDSGKQDYNRSSKTGRADAPRDNLVPRDERNPCGAGLPRCPALLVISVEVATNHCGRGGELTSVSI